jgi:hypothetical protein
MTKPLTSNGVSELDYTQAELNATQDELHQVEGHIQVLEMDLECYQNALEHADEVIENLRETADGDFNYFQDNRLDLAVQNGENESFRGVDQPTATQETNFTPIERLRDIPNEKIVCYKCGSSGHYASACENNRPMQQLAFVKYNHNQGKLVYKKKGAGQRDEGENLRKSETKFSRRSRKFLRDGMMRGNSFDSFGSRGRYSGRALPEGR